jgi:hypothetical protein
MCYSGQEASSGCSLETPCLCAPGLAATKQSCAPELAKSSVKSQRKLDFDFMSGLVTDGSSIITAWLGPVQLQIPPRLKVQIKFWDKDVSKSAPFHSLHIKFHCLHLDFHSNRIRYNKHGKTKRGIENYFKKTVTELKRPDGSLDFYGEVSFKFEFDAPFATLSSGFQAVTADPELKTRFENGKFMKVHEELKALMQLSSAQHIVLDLVARNLQKDIADDEEKKKVPKSPADPVLIAMINLLPGSKTNCLAVDREERKVYEILSIEEEYDLARYRTKYGVPRYTDNELYNRVGQMEDKANPLPIIAQEVESHFYSIE